MHPKITWHLLVSHAGPRSLQKRLRHKSFTGKQPWEDASKWPAKPSQVHWPPPAAAADTGTASTSPGWGGLSCVSPSLCTCRLVLQAPGASDLEHSPCPCQPQPTVASETQSLHDLELPEMRTHGWASFPMDRAMYVSQPRLCWHRAGMAVEFQPRSLLIQPGEPRKMARALGPLSPEWEARMKFLTLP